MSRKNFQNHTRFYFLCAAIFGAVYLASTHSKSSMKSTASWLSAYSAPGSAGCPSFKEIIYNITASGPLGQRPQLSDTQLGWMLYMLSSLGNNVNALVFGLGFDSPLWGNANCRGRTVYLEHDELWLEKIKPFMPSSAELYSVKYKGRSKKYKDFFAAPWLMDVPSQIADTCFPWILVDAPTGFEDDHPGRMEAAYFALETSKRCIAEKKLKSVYVFVHDTNRKIETAIIEQYFNPKTDSAVRQLDVVPGPAGTLVGFQIS